MRLARFLVWAVAFILCGTAVGADLRNQPDSDGKDVRIEVYDKAGLPSSVLATAGNEVKRIFRTAKISVSWIDCSDQSELHESCDTDPDNGRSLILRILPQRRASTDLVFGKAFLGADGFGRYADVYLNQVEQIHEVYRFNLSTLLGAIVAHELGHLLLGSGAHSVGGIMTPMWEGNQLRRVEMGALVFLPQQTQQMHKRIEALKARESVAVANAWQSK